MPTTAGAHICQSSGLPLLYGHALVSLVPRPMYIIAADGLHHCYAPSAAVMYTGLGTRLCFGVHLSVYVHVHMIYSLFLSYKNGSRTREAVKNMCGCATWEVGCVDCFMFVW